MLLNQVVQVLFVAIVIAAIFLEPNMSSRFWWLPFSFGPARVPGISADSLHKKLQEKSKPVMLIDVRNPGEFTSGHIEGSINVPVGRLVGKDVVDMVSKFAEETGVEKKQVEVVCICMSAHRSPPAVRLIQNADPELDVKQLDYGMANWWLKKLPTVKV